ncbi:MAG: hypothetical protein IT228_15350 [Flavobacteriales bacterium]|nr:hypothetical protein [Flavobacteriales bacterium]MCC6578716.1 hypothetical protein [Flavobacteriales bacterium]NUQ15946.1 Ig-like domain-containing protein [Flavobacteriales bacterium]
MELALAVALLLCVVAGCRKDKDGEAPVITILAPGAGAQLQVPGEVTVRAAVSDERQVVQVRFTVLDPQGIPVATVPAVAVDAPAAEVERSLALANEALRSGTYQILVSATDGTNETRAFRALTVVEAPLRLRAVHVVSAVGGQTAVLRIDSTGIAAPFATLDQDVGQAVLCSGSRTLVIAGDVSGPVTALDAELGAVRWQLPNTNALGGTFFTGLDRLDADRLVVARANGLLSVHAAANGAGHFTAAAMDGRYPRRHALLGDRLLSEQPLVAGNGRLLAIYTAYTGELLAQRPLDLVVAGFSALDDDRVLLFGERDGDGVVRELNVELGGGWEPQVLVGQPVQCMVSAPGQVAFLGTSAGLLRYTYGTNTLVPVVAGAAVPAVARDAVTGAVYIAVPGQVQRVDGGSGAVLQSWPVAGEVVAVLPFFNREP